MQPTHRLFLRALAAVTLVVSVAACTPDEIAAVLDAQAHPPPVEQTISDAFGSDSSSAVRVADCESSLDPGAVSPDGANYGLFQINRVHRADFEAVTGQSWSSSVLTAYWNTMYAKHLYDAEGWRPWACRWAA